MPSADPTLSGTHRELLELLHCYSFLSPRLLAIVYGARGNREGRGYWHVARELKVLLDGGFVCRFRRFTPFAKRGSVEHVYALSHEGAKVILDEAEYARSRREIYLRERQDRKNLEHTLGVATLQIVLTLGQDGWRLIGFQPDERRPESRRVISVRGKRTVVWPDASATVEVPTSHGPRYQQLLFELDRSRKSNARLLERFEAYAELLARLRRSETETVVVFIVTGESDLERFLTLADSVARKVPPASFLFWNAADWYDDTEGLRPPREILAEASLATLAGQPVPLVDARVMPAEALVGGQR
jgi:Replication-relaxation